MDDRKLQSPGLIFILYSSQGNLQKNACHCYSQSTVYRLEKVAFCLFVLNTHFYQGIVAQASNPSTWEVGKGGWELQDHPSHHQDDREFTLGYIISNLKTKHNCEHTCSLLSITFPRKVSVMNSSADALDPSM